MLKVRSQQLHQVARAMFIEKVDAAFVSDVPGYADVDKPARKDFIVESMAAAERIGLTTEQGIASYALAVWWLGLDFETMSEELETLLRSDLPEVRKVHGMNEWVHAALGTPDNLAAADEKLKEALKLTEPWGK